MNKSSPKISVIVPVYNTYKYLKRCIGSILNQTFQDLEIIIINDGSTDKSLQLLKKYSKLDKRVKIYTQENQGLSQARNNGIQLSKCKYITFVDSDDELPLDALENQYKNALTNKSDLVVGDIIYAGKNYQQLKKMKNHKDNVRAVFRKNIALSACCKLYKKSLLTKNNLYFTKNILYEDRDFTVKLFYYASNISFSSSLSYIYYYQQDHSISNSIKTKNIKDAIKILDKIYLFLCEKKIYCRYKYDFTYFTANLIKSLIAIAIKQPNREIVADSLLEHVHILSSFMDKNTTKKISKNHKNNYIIFIVLLLDFLSVKNMTLQKIKEKIPIYFSPKYSQYIYSSIVENKSGNLEFFIINFLITNHIKKIVIYGAGEIFLQLEEKLKQADIKILHVIDKKAQKKEFWQNGYKVKSKSSLLKLNPKIPIIIASFAFADEIVKDLEGYKKENGLKNEIYDLHRCLKKRG